MVEKEQIERKLIPRLKMLGLILIGFSLIAFVYSFFPEEVEAEEELIAEFSEPPLINMALTSAVFASVGAACITIAWKKKNANKSTNSNR